MKQLGFYCDQMKVQANGRLYLVRLTNAIVNNLYRREAADPQFGRMPLVHIWIRNAWQQPSEKTVEVDLPAAFIGKDFGPRDIHLTLIRHEHRDASVYPYLEHQQTHFEDADENADMAFVKALGLWPHKILIRLDAFHPDFPANLAR